MADLFLQVKINGDIALLKAVMYLMWEEEKKNPGSVFDLEFIQNKTLGFEAFLEDLKQTDYNEAVKASGLPESEIRSFAELLMKNDKIIICWAMGLTQHKNGVQNIREVVNLLLLRGSIGKPGAGTCPVRGHSNVQGDRTMGIWEAPPETFLDSIDDHFSIASPRKHGYDVVNAIKAMDEAAAREIGCITYKTSFDANNSRSMRIYEMWESMDALIPHFQTPHMAEFQKALGGLKSKSMEAKVYEISKELPFPN